MSVQLLDLFPGTKEKQSFSLDHSNPSHMEYILYSLGGERVLKEEFPSVHTALKNSQKINKNAKANSNYSLFDTHKENNFQLSYLTFTHSNTNKTTNKTPNIGCVFYTNSAPYGYIHPHVLVRTGIIDIDQKKVLASRSQNINNHSGLHKLPLQFDINEHVDIDSPRQFIAYAIWHCIVDVEGTPVLKSEVRISNIMPYFTKMYDFVKSFSMDPLKKDVFSSPIKVSFGRDDTGADKNYGHGLGEYHDGAVSFMYQFPFSGNIVLAKDYYPYPSIAHGEQLAWALSLTMMVPKMSDLKNPVEKAHVTTTPGSTRADFTFSEEWNMVTVHQSDATQWQQSTLNSGFYLNIAYKPSGGGPKETPYYFNTYSVDGGGYSSTTPTLEIPLIQVLWGCFGRDTVIRMADGGERRIDAIKEGDAVLTAEGTPVTVRGIIKGKEQQLWVLETIDGHKLAVSATHPVFTANRGPVKACKLFPGDEILLADGKNSTLKFIYPEEYQDDVYNLNTGDKGARLVANGIIAGDYAVQNTVEAPAPMAPLSPHVQSAVSEMERLFAHMSKV